ncbi:MAG: hypothetical protein AMJ61_03160 [Desulfobacterales bacterium SG8_35_2]|nr:MAG: hypothetical protein AMJ61_03160 [Desulfobacterales bacterium SG8_35_2]
MAKLADILIFSIIAGLLVTALPVSLQAEGLSLVADFEYFFSNENRTEKDTGLELDTDFSRYSQLYQVDISRFVYPNVFFNLGGYFEQINTDITLVAPPLPELSSDSKATTLRPYMEVNLQTPLYSGGVGYRKRKTDSSGNLRSDTSVTVDEYNGVLTWKPVDLPQFNLHYQHIDAQDSPLTYDATRDTYTLLSKYTYKDLLFHYIYNRLDNYNNTADVGNLSQNHNGGLSYFRGFDIKNNRFTVNASAKYIYNTIESTGLYYNSSVDRPADSPGTPFYILNDFSPTSNEPFELIPVDPGHPLTNVNIGRDGGLNPVSGGLNFNTPTDVDTVYIQLSNDLDSFPNLASPSQISSIANGFNWQFYSSDDLVELNWTEQPISSAIYNSIDNRFEIRLAAGVRARRIKVTTIPMDVVAPGEIRYDSISAYTTVTISSGEKTEDKSQFYTYGLQWLMSSRTTFGYEGNYRIQEASPEIFEKTTLTNSLYFRHVITQIFSTYGRVSHSDSNELFREKEEETKEDVLSLSLRADYLDTLSQTLTYSGAGTNNKESSDTVEKESESSRNSVILRTSADLYTGWSLNLDLLYAFNTLEDDTDQNTKGIRFDTIVEPNRNITLTLDYSINWTEYSDRAEQISQYGTFQFLWTVTDTLNTFFRYNLRKDEGENDSTYYFWEYNINWAPFPDGTLQFSIGYNESMDNADQKIKTLSPQVTWKIGYGIFFNLRYNVGTRESPTESTDLYSIISTLKLFY